MSFQSLLNRLVPGKAPAAAAWESPRVLDRGRVGRPQIAMDDQGHALAAWHHRSADSEGIFICRYHPDARGWDVMPRRLDSARTRAHEPEIAMNHRSELAVVWHEQEDGQVRVCARHMLGAEETWVPYPMCLQTGPGSVHSLHTAMDVQGNIHAVWCLGVPGAYQVYTSGYHAGEGAWDVDPTPLGEASPSPLFPQLALNGAGQGLAVWGAEDRRIVACHYDLGARCWSDRPTLVAEGTAAYLRLAMDPRGNAIALWVEEEAADSRLLRASHLDGRTIEWTRAPMLGFGREILWPQVGLDAQGRAHAVWRQEAMGAMKLFTKRYAGGRWEEHRTSLAEDLGDSQAHALSVNAQGQAVVLWLQQQGTQRTVCVRRFDGQGWGPRPVLLGTPGPAEIQNPGAVLSPSGRVGVIWRQGRPEDSVIFSALGQA